MTRLLFAAAAAAAAAILTALFGALLHLPRCCNLMYCFSCKKHVLKTSFEPFWFSENGDNGSTRLHVCCNLHGNIDVERNVTLGGRRPFELGRQRDGGGGSGGVGVGASENRVEVQGGSECRVVLTNQLLQCLQRRGGFGDVDVEETLGSDFFQDGHFLTNGAGAVAGDGEDSVLPKVTRR